MHQGESAGGSRLVTSLRTIILRPVYGRARFRIAEAPTKRGARCSSRWCMRIVSFTPCKLAAGHSASTIICRDSKALASPSDLSHLVVALRTPSSLVHAYSRLRGLLQRDQIKENASQSINQCPKLKQDYFTQIHFTCDLYGSGQIWEAVASPCAGRGRGGFGRPSSFRRPRSLASSALSDQ